MSSSAQHEVVRAGLAGGVDAAARAPRRPRRRPRPIETWTTCSEQPVSSASSSARSIAASSAAGGREATHARQLAAARRAQLATGARRARRPAGRARRRARMPAPSAVVVDRLEVLDPRVAHERLEADHAARGELVQPVERRRARARPRARSRRPRGRVAAATLASNAAPSTVGGWALSGISTQAVAPPAASAAVPVAQPSQSARPGSLKCTWASIAPGSTCSPRASISSRAGSPISGTISAITPSSTATSALGHHAGRTTVHRASITRGHRRSARARRAPPRRRPRRPPRPGCG